MRNVPIPTAAAMVIVIAAQLMAQSPTPPQTGALAQELPPIRSFLQVEKAGMKYFNIPVVYSAPTDAQADELLKITDDPVNRPMFI